MYTSKLILTNKSRIPMSLSNYFDDSFDMVDEVQKCKSAEEFCEVANRYGRCKWSIASDKKEETRLKGTDAFGNEHFLIAGKEQPEPGQEKEKEIKKKIMDTIIWYAKADDHGDVEVARKNGKVLYDLLQEIMIQ